MSENDNPGVRGGVSPDRLEDPIGIWPIEEGWELAGVAEVVRGPCEGFVASSLPMWRLKPHRENDENRNADESKPEIGLLDLGVFL